MVQAQKADTAFLLELLLNFRHPPSSRSFSGQPLIFNASSRGFFFQHLGTVTERRASQPRQAPSRDTQLFPRRPKQLVLHNRRRCFYGSRARARAHAHARDCDLCVCVCVPILRETICLLKNLLGCLSRRHHVGSQATLVDKACRCRCRCRSRRERFRAFPALSIMPIDKVRSRG